MEKYYAKKSSAETIESRVEQKRPRIELDMRDIVANPGDRKPIDDFHHDIRDEARRAYLQIGPYRPAGLKFPKTKKDGKGQSRGFVGSWFDQFNWLEYNVAKDAAYCFYYYLFKPQQAGFHTEEEAYKARLTIMLGIARFLLLQALAFRGHDESKTSRNKGNFMEMLEWYKKKDPKAALVTGENAPGNNQMSSPMVQKDLARACVEETRLIGLVMRNMNEMRKNGWDALFEEVKEFCLLNNIDIPNMEDTIPVRGRSRRRGAKLVSYYHYFHHGIFNVVIDQIYYELNNRFSERSTQLLRCVACLDPRDSFANFEVQKLVELAKIYKDDFCDYDCIKLAGDFRIFIDEVRNDDNFDTCTDLGNLAEKIVRTKRHTAFPLVYRLIELALILPVATTTVERDSSAMNIIKTERRNKMNDDWLNSSMMCYIERDLFASIEDEKILKHFQGL
ncbi:unnamed protein product [Miscanthus lutarioriparius]|uniref:DUF4371 domain-containing protein n=1 Tax=Miscanthus lutarioriparius TaxID=422564 RepID=A0A811MY50_9POAL|nr:unnamed protein product [Miscanthus lutarioriparius]